MDKTCGYWQDRGCPGALLAQFSEPCSEASDEAEHPVLYRPGRCKACLRRQRRRASARDVRHVAYPSGVQWRNLAWQPWLEAFSDHKLLSYDSRGCGLSDRDPGDLSFEAWIRDFESVIDAAGFQQISILATCQRGPVAIEYAARHPERVRKIVLYGTYSLGRMRRHDRPIEAEKTRVVASLVKAGWAQDNALLQIWAHAFQPSGTIEHWRSSCDFSARCDVRSDREPNA